MAGGQLPRIRLLPPYKWIVLVYCVAFMSIVYSAVFMNQPFTGLDFWELDKIFLYLTIFALVAS
jgi:hypothetical protein